MCGVNWHTWAGASILTLATTFTALAQESQSSAREGADGHPNVLLIVADDLGYSDLGVYGGEISTPHLDALAEEGLLFTNFYAHASCSPTRAMLMSGTDNHLAGVGMMRPPPEGVEVRGGYDAVLRTNIATLPELLLSEGYHTYMAGKWHLGARPNLVPSARGFERSFALMEGGASHFKQEDMRSMKAGKATWLEDGKPAELPDDFYSSTFLVDYLIRQIDSGAGDARPFLGYLAFTAPHWPVQAPTADIEAYRGRYDDGHHAIAAQRLARRKEIGLSESRDQETRQIEFARQWSDLTKEEQAIEARKMEVYAAAVTALDREVGRLIEHLKEIGEYDDTLILFMSDNGAEGVQRARDLAAQFDNSLENLGHSNSFVEMGPAWAQVSSTPNRMWKYTGWEGGYRVPAFVHFPKQISSGRTDMIATASDVLPTILDFAGTRHPGLDFNGRQVMPISGVSMKPFLLGEDSRVHPKDEVFGWEVNNFAALRKGDWKIVHDPYFEGIASEGWALYNLASDGGEWDDVADENPQVVADMLREWRNWVTRNNVEVNDKGFPVRPY